MTTENSVFILGAGASAPYGYPTAFELNEKIKQFLQDCPLNMQFDSQSQKDNLKVFAELGYTITDLRKFYNALFRASTISIDRFLENRPDLLELGKILTVYELKKRESLHNLFIKLNHTNWYAELFNRINLTIKNIDECNFKFITFNYDRSLETFLYSILKERTTESNDEVLDAFKKIPIIHVYGGMGHYPWEKNGIAYDSTIKTEDLKRMSRGIHIMGDERRTKDFNLAHDLIKNSKNIYFFGFSYDEMNLNRLKIKKALRNQNIIGTAYKINLMRKKEIKNYFSMNIKKTQKQTTYQASGQKINLFQEDINIMGALNKLNFYTTQ